MQSVNVKVLGLAALGAMFILAAPVERAQAVSLINPGAAQSTEVGWHHWHHHHWRWHHWHHRHWS